MKKWEYMSRSESYSGQDLDLNKYGNDGWELISVVCIFLDKWDKKCNRNTFYFKRERSD